VWALGAAEFNGLTINFRVSSNKHTCTQNPRKWL